MSFTVLMLGVVGVLRVIGRGLTRLWSAASATAAIAAVLVVATLVTVLVTSGQAPVEVDWLLRRVLNVVVAALFIFAGALSVRESAQRMTGVLLVLAGGCWLASSIGVALPGPAPFVGSRAALLFWWFTAWALLRYPDRRLATRCERAFVAAAGTWLVGAYAALSVFYDPSWEQWSQPVWWPTGVSDLHLYMRLSFVVVIGDGILVAGYFVLVARRVHRLGGVDRWVLAPMIASIFAAGTTVLLRVIAPLTDWWQQTLPALTSVALLTVPAALLATIVRRRLTHTAVADIVVELAKPDPQAGVADHLRKALRDPTLQVLFWVDEMNCYVDETGRPVPAATSGRLVVPIRDPSAEPAGDEQSPDRPVGPIGVVLADPALRRHQDLVNAAVGASGLALRNARLQAELRAQLDQVRASRKRIAEAGVAERRKIERDLHDGLQQRLLALTLTLAQARAATNDPPVLNALESMRTELHAAVRELRDVAHGVMPAMLAQGGLRPALDDVVERLPLDVNLVVPPGRWPPAVETTAYYIACEGLANVVKHAAAEHATVSITGGGNELRLEITDDGSGGADPTGTGLAGLADRARAIGGELTVRSTTGGTLLRVVLPCG